MLDGLRILSNALTSMFLCGHDFLRQSEICNNPFEEHTEISF